MRKVKSVRTPLRFATHRQRGGPLDMDEEETDAFDDVAVFKKRFIERMARARVAELMTEAQKKSTLPLSPASSSDHMDLFERDSVPVLASPSVDGQAQRDLKPVFSCYYGTVA